MPANGGRCPTCDATVEWVTTERNNKPMALDVLDNAEGDPNGNVVLVDTPAGPRARVFGRGRTPDVPGPRRTPHIATCPLDRDRWLTRAKPRKAVYRRRQHRAYRRTT